MRTQHIHATFFDLKSESATLVFCSFFRCMFFRNRRPKSNIHTIELMQIFKTDNLVANRHPETHWGIKKSTQIKIFFEWIGWMLFWMQFSMNGKSIIKKSSLECHYGIICIVQMYILCVEFLQLMSILICIVNVNFCILYRWMKWEYYMPLMGLPILYLTWTHGVFFVVIFSVGRGCLLFCIWNKYFKMLFMMVYLRSECFQFIYVKLYHFSLCVIYFPTQFFFLLQYENKFHSDRNGYM